MANKCDDMSMGDNGNLVLEEEHQKMMEQIEKLITENIESFFPQLQYTILPISAEISNIYRMYTKNPKCKLDIKYLIKKYY